MNRPPEDDHGKVAEGDGVWIHDLWVALRERCYLPGFPEPTDGFLIPRARIVAVDAAGEKWSPPDLGFLMPGLYVLGSPDAPDRPPPPDTHGPGPDHP